MSASNRAYGGRVPRGSIVVINFGMKVPKETAVHKRKREDECLSDKISKSDDIDNEPNVLNDIIKEVQTFQSNLLRFVYYYSPYNAVNNASQHLCRGIKVYDKSRSFFKKNDQIKGLIDSLESKFSILYF